GKEQRTIPAVSAPSQRLIVGITGASAPHYGVRLLEVLRELTEVEIHLVLSRGAHATIHHELGRDPAEVAALGHVVYDDGDMAAAISSGSFLTAGMIVAPCI